MTQQVGAAMDSTGLNVAPHYPPAQTAAKALKVAETT
eukprot:CAMPEP_0174375144 /NCGR_PEP_ID=MMETSP0811_2-20130205/113491_1 /TAXON_ID=73025 ORGANISM="Eutreptiella gymnastica-like, Strain CCMP1594" /NCGR_SAMPLE_ID=MMETSP0811_2 /ASSEMBLY_ACC=CAM_ASM_000667 /LENGTH=36 /DNA_ID= /DNA_START= /DNA_END= /DNA_ORIENTATION=